MATSVFTSGTYAPLADRLTDRQERAAITEEGRVLELAEGDHEGDPPMEPFVICTIIRRDPKASTMKCGTSLCE